MLSVVKSVSLQGLNGYLIDVQVDVSGGLPGFEIVGLPDISIRESKERVRTAIKNSGFNLFSRRILVNLAPATQRKEGTFLDLPIAIGILNANEYIYTESLENTAFIGELSLDGKINKINGALPMCIELKKLGIKKVVLPVENAKEVEIVGGLTIVPVSNLVQVVRYLNYDIEIQEIYSNKCNFDNLNEFNIELNKLDFSDVKGQQNIKRAVEVAASGGHNMLMIGTPGSGKTMIAKRIPTILPNLNFEECLEVTKIHSIAGELSVNKPIIATRPFRAPHHTISPSALVGGGKYPKPRRNKFGTLRSIIFR